MLGYLTLTLWQKKTLLPYLDIPYMRWLPKGN